MLLTAFGTLCFERRTCARDKRGRRVKSQSQELREQCRSRFSSPEKLRVAIHRRHRSKRTQLFFGGFSSIVLIAGSAVDFGRHREILRCSNQKPGRYLRHNSLRASGWWWRNYEYAHDPLPRHGATNFDGFGRCTRGFSLRCSIFQPHSLSALQGDARVVRQLDAWFRDAELRASDPEINISERSRYRKLGA